MSHSPSTQSLAQEISDYYNQGREAARLFERSPWERIRTMDLLSRFLPKPPATIFDVGGGAGVYTFPLAERGYEVHLLEPP